jgi:predicted esterase
MKSSFTILISILLSFTGRSQTQTPVYLSQTISNASCKGFYQYLPTGYNSSTKSYPLIIWVHGAGQVGQGNSVDLVKVLEWGLPKIISEGVFPSAFTVNDVEHSFIVISPQFMGWPSGVNINAMINYVSNNYRVDAERIYLMGISAGGGGIWDYASISKAYSDRIAAMIPFCGTLSPTQNLAGRIASSQLPVWAFHNTNDGTVPVAYSRNWVNYINSYVPTPNPLATLTEFPVQSNDAVTAHECWSLATLPSYKPQGINIYEWLLQYKRRIVIANAAPVARAGNDTSIVLPSTASLNGSASTDADGIISAYRWRKLDGPATHSFSDSTAANTIVSNLSPGVYNFELSVTDNGGATATDNITVTVYAAFAPGTQQRVLIDIGAGASTSSPSVNSLYWNNITDARPGIRLTNAVTTLNLPSGLGVNIINRLDGTYSTSSNGMATGNTTGIVNDYPASATTDLALIHSSGNGLWRITGMNPAKVYTIKFWGSRTNTTAQRTAEIKRADETTWKSYTATSNTNYNNAAIFLISGKTEMDFNIRTKSGSDFSALGVIDISFGVEDEGPAEPNNAPTANAGNDTTITLPAATVTLNGSGTDTDGLISTYTWTKLSGGTATITAPTSASTSITGLVQGVYLFELTVTDNGDLSAKDTVQVTVNAANITLLPAVYPANTVNGLDYKYYEGNWSALPDFTSLTPIKTGTVNNFNLAVANRTDQMGFSFTGFITVPADGMYTFYTTSDDGSKLLIDNIEIVDNDGLHASRERSGSVGLEAGKHAITGLFFEQGGGEVFTVSYEGAGLTKQQIPTASLYRVSIVNVNNPPTANAGSNINLQLPLDSVLLNGCASVDPEGAVLKFKWTKVSGPAYFTIANDTVCQARIRGLAAGTYLFELAVTDTGALSAKDTMSIIVQPINNPWPPVYTALCNDPYKIVILGSSTAYGTGASPIDSSWARKLAKYVSLQNPASSVVNLGLPGYNSYHIMPTGTNPPASRPFPVDTTHNITKALTLNPNAIIVNLPSNDIAFGVPVAEVKANFEILFTKADSAKVPVWFTTTQPRNNLSPSEKAMQVELKNWILQRFGNKAVDFWTSIAAAGDSIAALYSTGDGVHVNNVGHHLFFTRIVEEKIWDSICLRKNAAPVALAGNDIVITGTSANVQLNGAASYDPEGNALTYNWNIISGTGAGFNDNTIVNPTFVAGSVGQFSIVLTVTDDKLLTDTDTLLISITAPNILPVANAGADRLHNLPPDSLQLSGTGTDDDGTIAGYKWRKISGPSLTFVNDAVANPVLNNLVSGVYELELTVTDNRVGTGKDSMLLTVNALPLANAGTDIFITGTSASIQLNGTASSDPEGAILTYKWNIISGTGATLANGSTASPSFVTNTEGNYSVELKVSDPHGSSDLDTVMITIAAANILPVANAGADKLIHLPPNNTQLNGGASFDPDGTITTYKWRKITGPAMTFSNDAIDNPMANALTYGIYSFELVVTDNRGGIAKDTMLLTVNNPPTANAGNNATITLPVNTVTLNGAASSDIDGSITYAWSQIGTGANISSPSAPQTLVTFTSAGVYQFQLIVTDNRGANSTASVSVTVLPEPGVMSKTFKVNIFGGTNPFNNVQWNNWNVVSSLTSAKFNYDDGTASNVNAVITAYGLIADNGATYAPAATACPPVVLRYTSANTSYRTLTFSGMSAAKTYDLEFYASRSNTGNRSVFQVGNRYDTISTDNNINDVARFTGIVPDNNGRIIVTISRIGTWNYLSGFMITENTSTSSFARPGSPTVVIEKEMVEESSVVNLFSVHPNPSADYIYVELPANVMGQYKLIIVNMNGKTVLQKTGKKVTSADTEKIDVKELPKGIYLIKLFSNGKTTSSTVIKL